MPSRPPVSSDDTVVPDASIPYRKRTTSEPSRSTARPTTIASAVSGRAPSLTAVPICFISAAISRPCRAIQALCHMSITTAMPSTQALNSSWPEPSNAFEIAPAKRATIAAPTTPATTPNVTQRPRPATPRVAAMTMPTIRPASMTSRKTMMSAPSMAFLFRDHHALGGGFMILADKRVFSGREWPDPHDALRFSRDDLLDLERGAVEFLRRRVVIDDGNDDPLVGRHLDLGGAELVVLDRGRQRAVGAPRRGRKERQGDQAQQAEEKQNRAHEIVRSVVRTHKSTKGH